MIDEHQNTIIRFPNSNGERGEYESVEVGIERGYVRRGDRGSKIGPWVVMVKNGSIMSTGYIPSDAARKTAEAIVLHAAECDRRNNPEPVDPDADAISRNSGGQL